MDFCANPLGNAESVYHVWCDIIAQILVSIVNETEETKMMDVTKYEKAQAVVPLVQREKIW